MKFFDMKTFMALVMALLIATNINVYSQKSKGKGVGLVVGKIVDKTNGSALNKASAALYKLPDSTLFAGDFAEKDGSFSFKNVASGDYFVKVTYLGYDTYYSDVISISQENKSIDKGVISLNPGSTTTDVVEIVGEKAMISYSNGKKVFDVSKNISAAGGTATDVLKNLPSVDVDQDGNVSLRGSQNLRILINGKPSTLTGSGSAILDQIPATMVENIEIVTNPSAKYDAEGNVGFINIVLKREQDPGVNGMFTLNFGTKDKYNASVNLNYRLPWINTFLSYDFSKRRGGGHGWTDRKTFQDDTVSYLYQSFERKRNSLNNTLRAGFDVTIDKRNSFSVSGSFRPSETSSKGVFEESTKDGSLSILEIQHRISDESDNSTNFDLSGNYKHSLGQKGQEITVDAFYSQNDDDETINMNRTTTFGVVEPPLIEKTNDKSNSKAYTVQSDLVYTFDTGDKFESGVKASYKKLDGDFKYWNQSTAPDPWSLDTARSNRFVYEENIAAAYIIYNGKTGDLGYQFGLRYEYTKTNADQRTTNEVYKNDYSGFFPSANLNYKITPNDEFQINYSRRINRPGSGSLNPFIDYGDPKNLRYGNPNLKPEYVNAYEFGYIKSMGWLTLGPSIFYNNTDDIIARTFVLLSPGVIGMTSDNLAKGSSYGVELNVSAEAAKWWRNSLDFSYYKSEVKGKVAGQDLDNSDYSWSLRLNMNFNPTSDLSCQVIGFYMGPTVMAQGRRDGMSSVDLGAKYEIFEKKAAITFRVSDIFYTMTHSGSTSGVGFESVNNFKRESRVAFLGIQIKLNEGVKPGQKRRGGEEGGGGMDEME